MVTGINKWVLAGDRNVLVGTYGFKGRCAGQSGLYSALYASFNIFQYFKQILKRCRLDFAVTSSAIFENLLLIWGAFEELTSHTKYAVFVRQFSTISFMTRKTDIEIGRVVF